VHVPVNIQIIIVMSAQIIHIVSMADSANSFHQSTEVIVKD